MYYRGQGVKQNYTEATKFLRRSAEQGEAVAQNNLALMYDHGEGVVKNTKEAIKLYRKAAEQGNAVAQYKLAIKYYTGEGVVKNIEQAYFWTLLAAANADSENIDSFKLKRDEYEKELSVAQRTNMQKQAAQWMKEHDSE